jgi:signal transduction histidine kinase
MGYGTAPDERIFGWEGFTWMVERQREEIKGMRTEVRQNPVHRQIFSGDTSALFVDEISIVIEDNNGSDLAPLIVRNSTLLKYNGKKWMILHFHGSTPDANTLDGSAWPIEEWKKKNAELELLVKEKTAVLLIQNRELEIEAALERVRSIAMAMRNSKDIETAISVMFNQLIGLGIDMDRCGIIILNDNLIAEIWSTPLSPKSKEVVRVISGFLDMKNHPLLQNTQKGWNEKKDYVSYQLVGDEVQEYYEQLEKQPNYHFPKIAGYPAQQFAYCFFFKEGGIHVFTRDEFPVESISILKKFAKLFEQTYTRFLDLQKAEALARAAIRESSLDRVRARIAAIRNTTDLQQITPLIWNELKTLGIPFIRCGVLIMDEEHELVHTYLSTPEGKAIAAFHLPFCGISLIEKSLPPWRNQKIYKDHWDKKKFLAWSQELLDKGYIESEESYRVDLVPDHLHLYFVPFVQGMLYVGNSEPLPQESLSLIKSLADAFATAYARYEDFKRLEEAKEKIEQAFKELQDAKDQLVQQEKLASLGQLSAGIAHEIKNPLNFVNNFSELSIELIDELINGYSDSFDVGKEEIKDILNDVKSNLSKIHEHGTRADQIVKSMLQQSRGSNGQMEPTDLNALIKEYVNLAFHGMRAGKNPINVDIRFSLNESIGEINLIAEDFSRVLLNLCNNAFDAMRSKSISYIPQAGNETHISSEDYKPILSLRSFRENGSVFIEVEDNGTGIPEEIRNKILQPFFTTKKGNEGIGLGLSITNDIIKAHGGSLEIKSKENCYSIFQIQLTEQIKK